jgi:thermitase
MKSNQRQRVATVGITVGLILICVIVALIYNFSNIFSDHASRNVTRDESESSSELRDVASKMKSKKEKDDQRLTELSDAQATSNKTNKEESVMINDPAIQQAWGIKKSDAIRAWEISKGSRKIVVAVIDTGADINHEDLKNNIWTNPGETGLDAKGRDKASNGIDDDGNGYVDDVHGWNFVSNNKDLTDNHGHGTHIDGIIGAEAGNGKGIAGISPEVSLMVLKYFDPKVPNTDNLRNTVNSIKYAVKMNANIINYSGGGTEFSKEEHDAIEEARQKGILFVAAAGNEKSNSDKHKYYPADYGLSNIISVTAIDPSTEVLSSSNYGTETVDIAAPGQNILSTLPNNNYGLMTGTSQATAFVSGAAVLFMARRENFQVEDVKKYILATGDSKASLVAKCRTSKQLNLYKALTILDSGVSVSGIVADSNSSKQSFTVDKTENSGADGSGNLNQQVNNFSQLGQALMRTVAEDQKRRKLKPSERTAAGQ